MNSCLASKQIGVEVSAGITAGKRGVAFTEALNGVAASSHSDRVTTIELLTFGLALVESHGSA